MFPWKISWRDRSRTSAERNSELLVLDERGNQNLETASDYSGRAIGDRAIYRVHEVRAGDRPEVSRATRRTQLRSHPIAASFRRVAVAQNSAGKTIAGESAAPD